MSRIALFATGLAVAALHASPCLAQDTAAQLAEGKRLFSRDADPSCTACHTLKDAGADGQMGPDLDDLKPAAAKVAAALHSGMGASMPSYKAR